MSGSKKRVPVLPGPEPFGATRRQFVQGLSAMVPFGGGLIGNLGPASRQRGEVAPFRIYHVDDYGARGDCDPATGQGTDDTAAINRAIETCHKAGGGLVVFDGRKTYLLSDPYPPSQQFSGGPSVILRPGVSLDGQGCNLFQSDKAAFMGHRPSFHGFATITADLAAGAREIRIDDPGLFAPGDDVLVRAGDNGYIPIEPKLTLLARVVAVSGNVVTVDRPMPRAAEATAAVPTNRRLYKLDGFIENIAIRNFNLLAGPDGNPESGLRISNMRGILVDRLRSPGPIGAGIIVAQFVENCDFGYLTVRNNTNQMRHPAWGRAITLSNCTDCKISHLYADNIARTFSFVESHSKGIEFSDIHVTYRDNPRAQITFFTAEESEVVYRDVYLRAPNTINLHDTGGTPSSYVFHNLHLDTDAWPKSMPLGDSLSGKLFLRLAGEDYVYDFDKTQVVEKSVPLTPRMYDDFEFPAGLVAAYDTWLSPQAAELPIRGIFFGSESNNGYNIKDHFTPGQWREVKSPKGPSTDSNVYATPRRLVEPRKILVVTGEDKTPPADAELRIRMTIVPRVNDGKKRARS